MNYRKNQTTEASNCGGSLMGALTIAIIGGVVWALLETFGLPW